jgi:cytochrome c-type biogenesis protein CcmH/NrfG
MHAASRGPTRHRLGATAVAAALLAVTGACFAPVLGAGFLRYDDASGVLARADRLGFAPDQLAWMAASLEQGHYQPLTWASFAVDRALWGMDPRGFHLTNLALHGLAVLLAWSLARELLAAVRPASDAVSRRALDGGAAVAALLFAIHPLRVESVAWVTERRDVLAGVFYLGAVLVHVRGAVRGGRGRPWLVAALMLLSLLAKAWAVTLPAVLAVLEAWPLGARRAAPAGPGARAARRRASRAVLLLCVPALAALALAAWAQHSSGAARAWSTHTPWHRVLQAGYGACFYPFVTVLPLRLGPLYPLGSRMDASDPRFGLALAVALAVTGAVLLARRGHPALAACWCAYLVVVAPVLGFFQSGPQLVADRYSYLSCLPFAFLAGGGLRAAAERAAAAGPRRAALLPWAAALLAVAALGPLTRAQAARWSDDVTLWTHGVRVAPGSYFARYNLGQSLMAAGRAAEALPHFESALRRLPRDRAGRSAIRRATAVACAELGLSARAEALWRRMLEQDPDDVGVLVDLGTLAERDGRHDDAVAWWRRALEACSGPAPAAASPESLAAREQACARVRALLPARDGPDAPPP